MSAAGSLLHDWFASSAARSADRIAVELPPGPGRPQRQQWTYGELARAAASLRARLQPHVAGECIVAVLLPRGAELFAAQLAILSAGAAYTCLEASLPDEHIAFVLRDCKAVALLTDAAGAQRARQWLPADRIVDVGAAAIAEPPLALPAPAWLGPHSLAYVIYTSGTTGWPKGVLIEHRSITNLVAADVEYFGLGADDRIAQGSSPAYDSSVEETWLAWAAGAALVIMDHDAARLGPDLVPWLRQQRITVLCPPPTLLRATACTDPGRELPDLRLCYVGGEALPQDLADRWARDLWLENGYGPTECTVTVVRGRVHSGAPVGIGRPVRGHRALVLDEQLRDVATGAAGELCLAGPGLARGYLDRDELTRQKFVEHAQHGRIYRTGDLVRQGADGELFCLGRIDAQVKLRGHRVELEAVESLLAQCPGVRAAACRVQGEGSAQLLAGFVVPVDAAAPPPWPELAAALARSLPAHMLPQRYALLPALPVTVGGKLDRRALPDLPAAAAADLRPPTPPRDGFEAGIAAAFARALGSIDVGVDDDFFALGGNSLRAAELISALRGTPATAVLAVRDVYQERTVAALAARARTLAPAHTQAAGAAPRAGSPLLVTAAQAAFLLLVLAAGAALAWVTFAVLVPWLLGGVGLLGALLLLPLLGFAARCCQAGATLALAVAAKRLLIGRYRQGRTAIWSGFFLRHWLVQRLVGLVPWGLLQGTARSAQRCDCSAPASAGACTSTAASTCCTAAGTCCRSATTSR